MSGKTERDVMASELRRRSITALVFDFDGTLAVPTLDFAVMRRTAIRAMTEHVDVPGRPDLPTMELLALVGTRTEAARAARDAALKVVREVEIEASRRSELFPFVRPMLLRIRQLGLSMAIVTRNCPEAVLTVFPDVAEHSYLLTRDDVPRVKPDPDHLIRALNLLGAAPRQALMIGDHPMDIEVGRRAGTFTAGVASGESPYESLAAKNPDYLEADGGSLMQALGIL